MSGRQFGAPLPCDIHAQTGTLDDLHQRLQGGNGKLCTNIKDYSILCEHTMPIEWSPEEEAFLEELTKESMEVHKCLKWTDGIYERFQAKYPKRTSQGIRSHYRDMVKYGLTSSRSSAEGKMMSMASSAEEEMPAAEEEMPARKKQTQDAPEVAKENPTAADVGEDPTGGLAFHVEEPTGSAPPPACTTADVEEDRTGGLPLFDDTVPNKRRRICEFQCIAACKYTLQWQVQEQKKTHDEIQTMLNSVKEEHAEHELWRAVWGRKTPLDVDPGYGAFVTGP